MFTVYIFIYMIRSIDPRQFSGFPARGFLSTYLYACRKLLLAVPIYTYNTRRIYGVYLCRNPVRAKSPYTTQLFVSSGCKPIQLLNRLLLKRVVNLFRPMHCSTWYLYFFYNHNYHIAMMRNIKHYSAIDRHWTQQKCHEDSWSDLYMVYPLVWTSSPAVLGTSREHCQY